MVLASEPVGGRSRGNELPCYIYNLSDILHGKYTSKHLLVAEIVTSKCAKLTITSHS